MPAKTPAEQRADIDGKLDASLGRFDEQLRREQQRTASERDSRAASRADGATADTTAGGGDDIHHDRSGDLQSAGVQQDSSAGGESGSGGNASGVGAPGGRAGGGAGNVGNSGNGAKPIPSGEDDDIVARRLRRAAENETDPELKEKLWKEYRDYKENTKASRK